MKLGNPLSFLVLIGAFVVHYVVYAYRFMWYLDHANFTKLVSVYVVFAFLMVAAFVVWPRWWLLGLLAFLVMFAPAVAGVAYLVPIGPAFVVVAVASALPFVGVARLRAREG